MVNVTTSMFFDRPRVVAAIDASERKGLSKAGSFVRTRAQRSLRRRKRSAKTGEPPSHHGGFLKPWIFFGYDDRAKSVAVGPRLFRRTNPTIPNLLEFGGKATHWRTGKLTEYAQFPFMSPALAAEQPKFRNYFANTVR